MTVTLTKEDWERILFALSQFSHNDEFNDTLTNLREALGRID